MLTGNAAQSQTARRDVVRRSLAAVSSGVRRFAHIVTPVIVPESSDLFIAQPITLETMRIAKRFAEACGAAAVDLYSAHFSEGAVLVPPDFIHTALMERSTLDLGGFQIPLKLPLIGEILNRLHAAAANAEYLVYTNVDIGLLPNFYVTVNRLVEGGLDAFSINRRTISAHYRDLGEIPLMWAETGKPHMGWDCFVFRREAFPGMQLGDACLGAVNIGRLLLVNLILTSKSFAEFTDLHLTFHIGNEGAWRQLPTNDYRRHNLGMLQNVLHSRRSDVQLSRNPVLHRIVAKMKEKGQLEQDY